MLHRVNGSWYQSDDGKKKYLRVTRALEVINKPALAHWAANLERAHVAETAATLNGLLLSSTRLTRDEYLERLMLAVGRGKAFQRESRKALSIGSETHSRIEWMLKKELGIPPGEEPPLSPPAQIAFDSWCKWRDQTHLKPLFIESTVWSDEDEYAGTADLMAEVDLGNGPEVAILDWKTSRGIYGEMKLQNAAYVKAYCEMGHSTYPMSGILLRLPKSEGDPGFEAHVVPAEEQKTLYQGFSLALGLAKFMLQLGK